MHVFIFFKQTSAFYEDRYSRAEREKKGIMVGGGFGPVS
jgi:hypothetical protein